MTHNNISFLEALERHRSNVVSEQEKERSNRALEQETRRHNLATESLSTYEAAIKAKQQSEVERHNLVVEGETMRHNLTDEYNVASRNAITEAGNWLNSNTQKWVAELNASTQRANTQLQTDTQMRGYQIQADTSRYATDVQALTNAERLAEDRRKNDEYARANLAQEALTAERIANEFNLGLISSEQAEYRLQLDSEKNAEVARHNKVEETLGTANAANKFLDSAMAKAIIRLLPALLS